MFGRAKSNFSVNGLKKGDHEQHLKKKIRLLPLTAIVCITQEIPIIYIIAIKPFFFIWDKLLQFIYSRRILMKVYKCEIKGTFDFMHELFTQ